MSEAEARPAAPRVVEVGWSIRDAKPGFAWDPPRKFTREDNVSTHAKSVALCPAVIDHEARLFEILCPADMQLRMDGGAARVVDGSGKQSPLIDVAPKTEWRHPERPIVTAATPYRFSAGESVFVTYFPPFSYYRPRSLPGVILGGRMRIDDHASTLVWTFEWHDPKRELVLQRAEPWFYVRFETVDPSRPVRLVEAKRG